MPSKKKVFAGFTGEESVCELRKIWQEERLLAFFINELKKYSVVLKNNGVAVPNGTSFYDLDCFWDFLMKFFPDPEEANKFKRLLQAWIVAELPESAKKMYEKKPNLKKCARVIKKPPKEWSALSEFLLLFQKEDGRCAVDLMTVSIRYLRSAGIIRDSIPGWTLLTPYGNVEEPACPAKDWVINYFLNFGMTTDHK